MAIAGINNQTASAPGDVALSRRPAKSPIQNEDSTSAPATAPTPVEVFQAQTEELAVAGAGKRENETAAPTEDKALSPKDVFELAEKLGEQITITNRSLRFSINEYLGRTILTITDSDTDEVVRQIPSEEFIRVAEAIKLLSETLAGEDSGVNSTGVLLQDKV